MQIVRDLAGYSYGRSDQVRRAMSKKKADVMEKEKNYFIYGNEEIGVEGCIKRGIPEEAVSYTHLDVYKRQKTHSRLTLSFSWKSGTRSRNMTAWDWKSSTLNTLEIK